MTVGSPGPPQTGSQAPPPGSPGIMTDCSLPLIVMLPVACVPGVVTDCSLPATLAQPAPAVAETRVPSVDASRALPSQSGCWKYKIPMVGDVAELVGPYTAVAPPGSGINAF